MTDAPSDEPAFDYPYMVREALRQVPREVLRHVAEAGIPGAHHFYLSFRTDHPGVEVTDFLRERYPEEMTVVLQHQYWDLEVDGNAFSVGLSFGGRPEVIRVPFAALTAFIDPAAEFGLRFDGEPTPEGDAAPPERDEEGAETQGAETHGAENSPAAERSPAEVVSIDKFRKR